MVRKRAPPAAAAAAAIVVNEAAIVIFVIVCNFVDDGVGDAIVFLLVATVNAVVVFRGIIFYSDSNIGRFH